MSTRNISWGGKGGRCIGLRADKLIILIVLKSGSFNLLEPSGPVQVSNGIALTLDSLSFPPALFVSARHVITS